jgi:hypothetical protein
MGYRIVTAKGHLQEVVLTTKWITKKRDYNIIKFDSTVESTGIASQNHMQPRARRLSQRRIQSGLETVHVILDFH